jgi:hypothetical protein
MIRAILGLLIVFGAVGGMDDPDNSLFLFEQVALAIFGLILMYFGMKKVTKQ